NGYITYSDRNTKNEIKPLSYGLNEVLKLNPVTYRYKSFISPNNRIRMGLIAQEVEPIIPEVVIKEDVDIDKNGNKVVTEGAYLSMNYTDLIPVLIKAIQEQDEKIKKLEEKINTLENQE
ncbi:MAG: tail fiber domain-containing protein, partial [Flavobacteriaceae bacterium]|nr:tail fiber domain-containing protein [Flavobacteriaceae bacterium]